MYRLSFLTISNHVRKCFTKAFSFQKIFYNIKRVDYPIFRIKYSVFVDFRYDLLAFLRANAGGNRMLVTKSLPQDVAFLDFVPSIATLWGLIYSLFPRDIELASSNQHRTKEMRMHFRGVEQASTPIYRKKVRMLY